MSQKLNRMSFLDDLNMVKAGLSSREYLEQSSCFVFQDGWVMTFNDEVSCRKEVPVNITGAVQANSLLEILSKMDEDDLMLQESPKGEIEFKGKGRGFGVTKEAEIHLPIDRVEMPEKWNPLKPAFIEAIGLVKNCVSTEESQFVLNCIHIHPDWIEASDNFQVMRCHVKTGYKKSLLVRGKSIQHICTLGVDQIAVTRSWVHFKNQAGLIFSCRRFDEEYYDLSSTLDFTGNAITIPKGLAKASDRAAIFASDKSGEALIMVDLKEGKMRIKGEGLSGWYKEFRKVDYKGPAMSFLIAPDLLKHVSEQDAQAEIGEGRLKISGGKWEYATSLAVPEEKATEESED